MTRLSRYAQLLLLPALLPAGFALAASPPAQAHDAIVRAVDSHLQQAFAGHGKKLQIRVSPPDHRLRLTPCATPLQSFDPPGGVSLGHTTVGVRCASPKPWTIYLSANVGLEIPVVVAGRDLGRGDPIEPGDLELRVMDTTHLLRGYFTDREELLGDRLKRTLRRGQAVTPSMLVVQKTVRRGEQITILSAIGPIEVRSQGKALRDGSPGDLIPVQNLASKKQLQARVVSTGLVSVE